MLGFDAEAECTVRGNELAYTVENAERKIIVVITAGTGENFYDTLKRYMR